MPGPVSLDRLLFLLETVATAGLLARVFATRLHRRYPIFFAYLAILLLQDVVTWFINPFSNAYVYSFIAFQSVVVIFEALVLLELYSLVLKELPGIAAICKRFIRWALIISVVVPMIVLLGEGVAGGLLENFFVFMRTISFSLLLFVLLISVYLSFYPVSLARNVIVYTIGYGVFFLAQTALLFLRTMGPGAPWTVPLSNALMCVAVACLTFWTFALNPGGEGRTAKIGLTWKPSDEERLIRQLEAVNARLVRASKK